MLIIVAIVLGVVLTSGSSSAKPALDGAIDWSTVPDLQTGPPPWPNNSETLESRLAAIGLNALPQEALAFHIHQHLDLYLDGKKVIVPRYIGISVDPTNSANSFLTEIHTHTGDGVIHVESPQTLAYQLGQLFGAWGVKLTATCLGRYCGKLQWWVNGKKQLGDPARLVLKQHQEIVVAFGKPPPTIPTKYDFPAGE